MVTWFTGHILEIFGAVTGIVYVILEIRRNILLWPLGIVTSAVYIVVFGDNGFYAGMVLQGYYVIISVYGWYAWHRAGGKEQGARSKEQGARSMEQGAWRKLAIRRMAVRQSREAGEHRARSLGKGFRLTGMTLILIRLI